MSGGGHPIVQFRMHPDKKERLDAFMVRLGFYKGKAKKISRIEYSRLAVAIADSPELQDMLVSNLKPMDPVDKKDSVTSA